jgi:kynurenine formamidase
MMQPDTASLTIEDFQELFERCSNWGRWGPDDERGTLNLIEPEHTRRAASLVQEGLSVSCALPLNTVADDENHSPALHLMIRAGDTAGMPGARSTADFLGLAPHGQAHSHLDALCHFYWQKQIYNGRPISTVTSVGAQASSIAIGAQGIVSRGVLLDIPPLQDERWLEPGTAIWPDDLEAAEQAAGLRVGQGDILLIRSGRHVCRREQGPWDTRSLMAGLHHDCVPWLRERGVAVLGCDGISDVVPGAFEGVPLPIHVLTLVSMGMQLLDNLFLDDLAAACAARGRWEFLLVLAPLRLERGTASALSPLAIF